MKPKHADTIKTIGWASLGWISIITMAALLAPINIRSCSSPWTYHPAMQVGREARVGSTTIDDTLYVCTDEESFIQLAKAQKSHDVRLRIDLVRQGNIVPVSPGTKVRIADYSKGLFRVKVLDGISAGFLGMIPIENIEFDFSR